MFLLNGEVHTMAGEVFSPGYVSFENGKITGVGPMEDCQVPAGTEAMDVGGGRVFPGLVDAHSHLGLFEDGTGADDANEVTDCVMPQLCAVDALNPFDRCFWEARQAGVTCVLTGPGSANPIGGQMAAVKTAGRRVEDMVVRAPAGMKFSLGENPKKRSGAPATRMGTAAAIRGALVRTADYFEQAGRKSPQKTDEVCEALMPVLRRKIPAHFHVHRADDILTALRLSRQYGLDPVLVHCTEGWKVADLLAEAKARVIVGPVINDRCKPELVGMRPDNAVILKRAGVQVAVCTDHPENPQQYLALAAGLCAREGLDDEEAMACITCDAAQIAGIADRVGTLRPGKDADIAVFRGHPLEIRSRAEAVFVNGIRVV